MSFTGYFEKDFFQRAIREAILGYRRLVTFQPCNKPRQKFNGDSVSSSVRVNFVDVYVDIPSGTCVDIDPIHVIFKV
jgi:hypothetical protein